MVEEPGEGAEYKGGEHQTPPTPCRESEGGESTPPNIEIEKTLG